MNGYQIVKEILISLKDSGKNYYTISFFPVRIFKKDLIKRFKTSRISKVIEAIGVSIFGTSTIKIHKFFIPELLYILKLLPSRRRYEIIINKIENDTWFKNTYKDYRSRIDLNLIKKNMNVELKQYQKEFIELYDNKKQQFLLNGYILSFEQGLGKTITSLSLMESLNKDCVIIIAPKSILLSVWKNEIQKFYKEDKKIWVVNYDKPQNSDIYIFNYESLNKFSEIYSWIQKKKNIGIIIDESHNFLHSESIRTKNVNIIKEKTKCEDILLMSGTPIKALGTEMIPVLKILDPLFDNDAQELFIKAFGLNTHFANEILRNRMGMIMHRKLKSDVLKLPKKIEKIRKITISNGKKYTLSNVQKLIIEYVKERELFYTKNKKEFENDFNDVIKYLDEKLKDNSDYGRYLSIINILKEKGYDPRNLKFKQDVKWANDYEKYIIYPLLSSDLKKKFLKSKSVVKYLNLKIRGEVLGNLLGKLRSEMTSLMIKNSKIEDIINNSEKKTIIFTTFVDAVKNMNDYLKDKKFKPILIYGETSKNIKSMLLDFKNNYTINPLVATIQTLSTGVTLTEANTVIFLNKPWRYSDYQQASDRVHRIGQSSDVYIYTFLLDTGSEKNLSEKMEEIMQWSKNMFEDIIGDRK